MLKIFLKTVCVAALVIAFRSLDLGANISPLGAMAIILSGPGVLLGLAISDLWLGAYAYWPFVYGGFVVYALSGLGMQANDKRNWVFTRIALGSLGFFIVSNLGVFVMADFYSKDLTGLVACFVAAIPFGLKSLVSDLCFGFVMSALLRVRLSLWSRQVID